MSICITASPSVNESFVTDVAFTPASISRQPLTSSGFPSGVFGNIAESSAIPRALRISGSTKSGFATAVVKSIDTAVVDLRSQHLGACSSGAMQTRRTCSEFLESLGRWLCPGLFSEVTTR